MSDTLKTALFAEHQAAGARMVPFAGYVMPIQYDGILAEHARVREQVGLFDVSHMGEVWFRGPEALSTLNGLVTNDLLKLRDGRAQYNATCETDGTIVDDLIIYRFSEEELLVCVNASNRHTDVAHFRRYAEGDAAITDESDSWSQIAVQGPNAPALLGRLFGEEVSAMRPFRVRRAQFEDAEVIIATTGYTGEAGGEVYMPNRVAAPLWRALMRHGEDLGVGPTGLGARDTLRLESAYCLYGNDIDRTTTPLEAGLAWITKLDRAPFVGREALLVQRRDGVPRRLVGIEMVDRGIARHGYPIVHGDKVVGRVTSGTKSPTTGRSIAMGYVPLELIESGSEIHIDCRGKLRLARVVDTPFYTRS